MPAPILAVGWPRTDSPGLGTVANEIADVLSFDLTFSKALRLFDDGAPIRQQMERDHKSGHVDYAAWKALGILYVVTPAVRDRGRDQLVIDVLVEDVRDGRRLMGKRLTVSRSQLRKAVHRMSDMIVYACAREDGIAQTSLLFVHHNPASQSKDIFLVDYDGWPESVRPLTRFGSITQFPKWSPDGKAITFCSFRSGWLDAYIQDLITGQLSFLAKSPGNNLTPSWSPINKDWLAISLSFEGNAEIYLVRRDGKNPKRLTHNRAIDSSPAISPNGRQIVFTSDRSRVATLYTMGFDGSNVRRLVNDGGLSCDTGQWSPVPIDGKFRIAFRGYRVGQVRGDIYTIAADGSDLRNLTRGRDDNSNPTWSPEGNYIAFSTVRRSGKSELWVMECDGSTPRKILSLAGNCVQPAWSPRQQ